jgi:hypothetical protein
MFPLAIEAYELFRFLDHPNPMQYQSPINAPDAKDFTFSVKSSMARV